MSDHNTKELDTNGSTSTPIYQALPCFQNINDSVAYDYKQEQSNLNFMEFDMGKNFMCGYSLPYSCFDCVDFKYHPQMDTCDYNRCPQTKTSINCFIPFDQGSNVVSPDGNSLNLKYILGEPLTEHPNLNSMINFDHNMNKEEKFGVHDKETLFLDCALCNSTEEINGQNENVIAYESSNLGDVKISTKRRRGPKERINTMSYLYLINEENIKLNHEIASIKEELSFIKGCLSDSCSVPSSDIHYESFIPLDSYVLL